MRRINSVGCIRFPLLLGSVVTRFRQGRGTPCYDHLVQTVHNLIATSLMPRFVFLDVGTSLYVQCWLDCRRTPHVALTHSCQVSSRAFDAVQLNLSPITCTGLLLLSPLIRPQPPPGPRDWHRGDWKRGSGKCDTVKIARVENAGVDNRGGKCRSKSYGTPIREYIEKTLSYFVILVLILLTE